MQAQNAICEVGYKHTHVHTHTQNWNNVFYLLMGSCFVSALVSISSDSWCLW